MIYTCLFVIGTVVGSFLNVCIYRIPRKISIIKPDSFCPNCNTPIPIYYNIPLIGYLILRAKCHSCYQKISFQYFLVELVSGILTVVSFNKFGFSATFFYYIVLIYFLLLISFIDVSIKLIYNRVLVYLLTFGVFLNVMFNVRDWTDALIGFFVGGGSLLFFAVLGLFLFKKESMGMGDVKLAAVLGFFLGWKMVLLALFLGCMYAGMTAILIALTKNLRIPQYLPMAPFFTSATLTFIYWGPTLIKWYWNLFLPTN